ncbi:hypothetical protein ACLOJK_030746 [Asimina triloba]
MVEEFELLDGLEFGFSVFFALPTNDFFSLGFIPEGEDIKLIADALKASFGDESRQRQDFQGIMDQLYDVMYEFNFSLPPDYALVIRALGSLEGTAKALYPDFKVVESAYPFVIGRLLADPSPDMRKILRELLICNDGSIRWNRLERLPSQIFPEAQYLFQVTAISEQASVSTEELPNKSTQDVFDTQGRKSFDMRSVVAATEDVFHFILSDKGRRVRVFLVQDIIKAGDAFLHGEVLPCIFDENVGLREMSDIEFDASLQGHATFTRLANGFKSFWRAVNSAPEVWAAMLIRLALKPEVHRFILDVISALARHSRLKLPEAFWLCVSTKLSGFVLRLSEAVTRSKLLIGGISLWKAGLGSAFEGPGIAVPSLSTFARVAFGKITYFKAVEGEMCSDVEKIRSLKARGFPLALQSPEKNLEEGLPALVPCQQPAET